LDARDKPVVRVPKGPRLCVVDVKVSVIHLKFRIEFMRLSKEVEGMVSNYQRLIDGYIAGVPAEQLARANQQLGGNFDGAIKEVEF
jgi:hypothetical protein